MRAVRTSLPAPVHRKLCLSCGYDGVEIQEWGDWSRPRGMHFSCPACGEDLYARPPRSYAELEGLVEDPACFTLPAGAHRGPVSKLRQFAASFAAWLRHLGLLRFRR
jgi:predicted RNA-binding Zn-ribbon protein involved in translation (DUF1610 family)